MGKSELEALLARIDVWLLIFGIIVVIGVAGESFFGIRHWWNSRKLQKIQEQESDALHAEIARLGKETADANARAAEANRIAEEERLARLKLEEKIAPRRLTSAEISKLARLLEPFAGSSLSIHVTAASGLEGTNLANDILAALNRAHIATKGNQRLMDSFFGNVILKAGQNRRKEADIIAGFLIETGLSPKPVQLEQSQDENELRIQIGSKP
jgi:hypothetical protein